MVIILPVVQVMIVVAIGYMLARVMEIHQKTISRLSLYIFGPALVFRGLYVSEIKYEDLLNLSGSYFVLILILIVLAFAIGRILQLAPQKSSAFCLSTSITNVGNMGLPMVIYALGEQASGPALLIYVLSAIQVNTIGVYIASKGKKRWQESIKNVFRMPTLYAAILGLATNYLKLTVPVEVLNPVNMLAQAAIPAMLILLGTQLAGFQGFKDLPLIVGGAGVKLLLAPLLAAVIATWVFRLPPSLAQVFMLQMAMPTAVNSTILAVEFEADAHLTAGTILFTTVCSIATIPVWLYFITM